MHVICTFSNRFNKLLYHKRVIEIRTISEISIFIPYYYEESRKLLFLNQVPLSEILMQLVWGIVLASRFFKAPQINQI